MAELAVLTVYGEENSFSVYLSLSGNLIAAHDLFCSTYGYPVGVSIGLMFQIKTHKSYTSTQVSELKKLLEGKKSSR